MTRVDAEKDGAKARKAEAKAKSARLRSLPDLAEKQIEALTVAMVLAPGVYARNRMFDFLSSPGARRARTRAATIRGVARQLPRATGITVENEPRGNQTLFVLRYAIAALRLTRVVELSPTELAALRLLVEKGRLAAASEAPPEAPRLHPPEEGERALIEKALTRLFEDGLAVAADDPTGQLERIKL